MHIISQMNCTMEASMSGSECAFQHVSLLLKSRKTPREMNEYTLGI